MGKRGPAEQGPLRSESPLSGLFSISAKAWGPSSTCTGQNRVHGVGSGIGVTGSQLGGALASKRLCCWAAAGLGRPITNGSSELKEALRPTVELQMVYYLGEGD